MPAIEAAINILDAKIEVHLLLFVQPNILAGTMKHPLIAETQRTLMLSSDDGTPTEMISGVVFGETVRVPKVEQDAPKKCVIRTIRSKSYRVPRSNGKGRGVSYQTIKSFEVRDTTKPKQFCEFGKECYTKPQM